MSSPSLTVGKLQIGKITQDHECHRGLYIQHNLRTARPLTQACSVTEGLALIKMIVLYLLTHRSLLS